MAKRVFIGTNKATGISYRYMTKKVWYSTKYTCDIVSKQPAYCDSLIEAKAWASAKGILSIVSPSEMEARKVAAVEAARIEANEDATFQRQCDEAEVSESGQYVVWAIQDQRWDDAVANAVHAAHLAFSVYPELRTIAV